MIRIRSGVVYANEAPVYRNDKHDFYALSRYADVEAAHRDPRTFSSARGTVLELMGNDLASTEQMIFLDPPEHTRLRHFVSRAFHAAARGGARRSSARACAGDARRSDRR